MVRSAHFRMADRLANGELAELITRSTAAGWSPEKIAQRLHSDFGIEVSGMTIRRWIIDIAADARTDGEAS